MFHQEASVETIKLKGLREFLAGEEPHHARETTHPQKPAD